jgi:hypothetical protein
MSNIAINDRTLIKEFFFPKTDVDLSGCVVFFLWIILHVAVSCFFSILCLFLTVPLQIAVFICFNKEEKQKPEPKITGTQIDNLFDQELELLKARSFDRLGLDNGQIITDPVIFVTPKIYGVRILQVPKDTSDRDPANLSINIADKNVKLEEDEFNAIQKQEASSRSIRYTLVEYTIFLPTESYLAQYAAVYSRITGRLIVENTKEIFYTDITQVCTEKTNSTQHILVGTGKEEITSKSISRFCVEMSSGSKISIDFDDPQFHRMFGNNLVNEEYADAASRSLRKIVREKKG